MKRKYWIAFSSIEQIDSSFIQKLYEYFGDIEAAFNASLTQLKQIDGLSVKKCENFLKHRDKVDIDRTFTNVETRGINFLTLEEFQIRLRFYIIKESFLNVILIKLLLLWALAEQVLMANRI